MSSSPRRRKPTRLLRGHYRRPLWPPSADPQQRSAAPTARWVEMALANARNVAANETGGAPQRYPGNSPRSARRSAWTARRRESSVSTSATPAASETVASCVVFGAEGAVKSGYRRFNISAVEPGDDYAAMRQVVRRRYHAAAESDAPLPDLILIDGGKGQLTQAAAALDGRAASRPAPMAVAKGAGRKPGHERLHLLGADPPSSSRRIPWRCT